MHADWQEFLRQRGATIATEGVTDFGNPDVELRLSERGTLLADLSQSGMIRVDGPDARDFLQGQLSTDVLALTPVASQLTTWNNAKGRVMAILRLCERDGTVYMALPRLLTQPLLQRLSMYVLRSKVRLTEASDTLAHFGIAGPNATAMLSACFETVPDQANIASFENGVTLIRLHGETPRFDLQGNPSKLISLWDALEEKGACPAGADPWALLRILSRVPVIYLETSGHFVAQMLGLEELGALDFNKGCYIGQEVIARAHYRGAVKRHLCRASCTAPMTVQPGTTLLAEGMENAVGEIVEASRDAKGNIQMLAVIQDDYRSAPLSLPNFQPVRILD